MPAAFGFNGPLPAVHQPVRYTRDLQPLTQAIMERAEAPGGQGSGAQNSWQPASSADGPPAVSQCAGCAITRGHGMQFSRRQQPRLTDLSFSTPIALTTATTTEDQAM